MKLNKMLNKCPEYCLKRVGKFSSSVVGFVVHSRRLSPQQSHFLQCLIQFKEEMIADADIQENASSSNSNCYKMIA
jgi:hypothetical protein